jgi:hypothetical protein
VKQHLLLGGACTLNEALNQALRIEAARATAWPTARLREVTRLPTGRPPTPPAGSISRYLFCPTVRQNARQVTVVFRYPS